MRQLTLLSSLLLVVLVALAQASGPNAGELPAAPYPLTDLAHSDNSPPALILPTAVSPVPPVQKSPRVLDRKFTAFAGAGWLMTIADIEWTQHNLASGAAYETNPIFGSHPSRLRMYGTVLPINSACTLVSRYMRKRNPRGNGWMWPLLGMTAGHTAGVITNMRIH
jgi:hypothetical protein